MAGAAVPRLRWPRKLKKKKKKPQHKLTLGRGWRGSIFPKADYPPPPLPPPPPPPVLPLLTTPPPPSHSLSKTSCSLGSCFDNADLCPRGRSWSAFTYASMSLAGWMGVDGWGVHQFRNPPHANQRWTGWSPSVSDAGKAGAFRGPGLLLEPLPLDGRPLKSCIFPGVRAAFTPISCTGALWPRSKNPAEDPRVWYECVEFLFPPGFKIQMIRSRVHGSKRRCSHLAWTCVFPHASPVTTCDWMQLPGSTCK